MQISVIEIEISLTEMQKLVFEIHASIFDYNIDTYIYISIISASNGNYEAVRRADALL